MRALEKRAIEEAGIPAAVLMENAGRAVAEEALRMSPAGLVVVVCGRGNNGGDGFVAARHLDIGGAAVRVVAIDPARLEGDALANYRALRFSGADVRSIGAAWIDEFKSALSGAALVVDALIGTGLSGELREPWPAIVAAVNDCGAPVLAVDIPSGLDGDTGDPLGAAIRASRTVTFHAAKAGFEKGREFTGEVVVAGIGIPRNLG
ncbi:MAG: carbohydrate [Planctomycetota bacterium]|nr:MAG: carbohydrate [Planctomycetota bacterium]